jgi:hypothetical protein
MKAASFCSNGWLDVKCIVTSVCVFIANEVHGYKNQFTWPHIFIGLTETLFSAVRESL